MSKKHKGSRKAVSQPLPRSDILPLAEPRFQGHIGTYYTDAKADIPAMAAAPDD